MHKVGDRGGLLQLGFAFDEQLRSGAAGPFEVELEPGDFGPGGVGGVALKLGSPAQDTSQVDLVLRGAPAPAVSRIRGGQISLHARELELRDLQVVDTAAGGAELMLVGVGRRALFERFALRACRQTAPFSSVLLALQPAPGGGGAGGGPRSVLLRSAWFVGNRQHAASALLGTRASSAGLFGELRCEACAFVGNEVTTGILPLGTAVVGLQDSVIVAGPAGAVAAAPPAAGPRPPGVPGRVNPLNLPPGFRPPPEDASPPPPEAAFLRRVAPDQVLSLEGSLLVLDRWERLAQSLPFPPGAQGRPLQLRACEVWLTEAEAGSTPPPWFELVDCTVRRAPQWPLAQAMALAEAAAGGGSLDTPALRAALTAALTAAGAP